MTTEAPPPSAVEPEEEEAELDVGRIVRRTLIGVVILISAIALAGYLFQEPLVRWSRFFVDTLGGPGVAFGFFMPDAFTWPWPNDAFTTFGLVGGMEFWTVVFWGSLGSLTGGCTGFGVGRWLRTTRWFRRVMRRKGAEMRALVKRYGVVALAVAALTPLPYSLATWACGAMGMEFRIFALVSLLRIPRIAFYLWLIQLGFITVVG